MPQQPASYSAYGFSGGPTCPTNSVKDVQAGPTTITVIETAKNTAASDCYLLLFNAKAANVTLGTTIPARIIPILAGTKYSQEFAVGGMYFTSALSIAMVMSTVTGTTAPTTPFGVDIVYQ